MSQPVNFQRLDPSAMETALEHALFVIELQSKALTETGVDPAGASILELGPGSDFGPALVLAAQGARVTVADRFLAQWQADFHPAFYGRLAAACPDAADQLVAAAEGGYGATTLNRIAEPAEDMKSIPSGSIDFSYSGAVLEHVVDVAATAKELARVTKVGGRGSHIIDLRYHRDFGRPLDHLVMDEEQFLMAAEDAHYEFGNRYRVSEFEAFFSAAGLAATTCTAVESAAHAYLNEILPALRRARSSYRHWPEEDLSTVICRIALEKEAEPPAGRTIRRGEMSLALMRALRTAGLRADIAAAPDEALSEIVLSPGAMHGPDGKAWIAAAPGLPTGDTMSNGYASQAVLYEDDRALGPAHSAHEDIRARGGGRYSHWDQQVYFSTSDNSSPITNRRRYTLLFKACA